MQKRAFITLLKTQLITLKEKFFFTIFYILIIYNCTSLQTK